MVHKYIKKYTNLIKKNKNTICFKFNILRIRNIIRNKYREIYEYNLEYYYNMDLKRYS